MGRSAPPAGPRQQLSDRRQQEDLSSAIFQLLRNVALVCNDPLLNSCGGPAREFSPVNPFAILAGQQAPCSASPEEAMKAICRDWRLRVLF